MARKRDKHHGDLAPSRKQQRNYNRTPRYHSSNGRGPGDDWTESNYHKDDQIAPKATSQSAESLQRWALATADIPQEGHHHNEGHIIDRIQRRYGSSHQNPNAPFPSYSNETATVLESVETRPQYGHGTKRERSISPSESGNRPREDLSAMAFMRQAKRQRENSRPLPPMVFGKSDKGKVIIDLTKDDDTDYSKSSDRREVIDLT